jgi:DNA-binding beta-propeller fold protein YncE
MSLLGFACSPDKTRLYTIANVINEPITSIWEVDANTLQQTAVLYTGSDLVKMAISPDGKQLYVICQAEDASKNSQLLIFGIG